MKKKKKGFLQLNMVVINNAQNIFLNGQTWKQMIQKFENFVNKN